MKNKCITDFQLMEGEELKDIPGFENYKASNKGRIFSYTNENKPKLLQPGHDGGGCPVVSMMKDGKKHTRKVARIVGETWLENPDNKPFVRYINPSDKDNVTLSNLEWSTPDEIGEIAYRNLKTRLQQLAKERSQGVYAYTKDYEQVSAFTSTASAAKELGLSQGNISSCCQGSLPTYKGLIWSYNPELTKEKREELLEQNKAKFIKNRLSTYKAVEKYRKKPENVLKARKKAIDWYWENIERAKERQRRYYARQKQRREEETETNVL